MKALCSWDFKISHFLKSSIFLLHPFRQCDPAGRVRAQNQTVFISSHPLATLSKVYFSFRVLIPSVAPLIGLIVKADLNSVGVTCLWGNPQQIQIVTVKIESISYLSKDLRCLAYTFPAADF